MERFASHGAVLLESFVHGSIELKLSEIITFNIRQLTPWTGSHKQLTEDLRGMLTKDSRGVILAGTEKAAKSLAENLRTDGFDAEYATTLERARALS